MINPFKACKKGKEGNDQNAIRRQNVKKVLQEKIAELGRMTVHEIQVKHSAIYLRLDFSNILSQVLFFFISLVLLWLFRDPKFIKGWGNFVKYQ